jgi:hypothetical protein
MEVEMNSESEVCRGKLDLYDPDKQRREGSRSKHLQILPV